jgi:eukaryotic-like serine/threonine-protein kinase
MTGVLVPFIVFASITAWVLGPRWLKMLHEQRMRQIELMRHVPQLPAAAGGDPERKQLEERLRTLETIVCSVDYELNSKLNRLASRQLLLSPPTPSNATTMGSAATIASTPPPPHPSLMPGHLLAGRFLLERTLGEGGMGAVWLARDQKLGEPVAVKVIRDALLADPQSIERFKREVTAARRVLHPNVVRLHDIGEETNLLFISMEYVEGESIAELIRRRGPLPLPVVRPLLVQLCDALEAAHAVGVIHRDLKPANVLVANGGTVKVIDFGVAKLAQLEGMTATNLILGTPEYMAPEQIRGANVDARTDLYSVGMIAHEALLGRTPFRGESPIGVAFAACSNPVPPLRASRADLSEGWDHFVLRALAKEPGQRFVSAAEMRASIPSA